MTIIYIGMPRTAVTWMQKYLFPNCISHSFYGKSFNKYPTELLKFNYLDDIHFKEWIFSKKGTEWLQEINQNKYLISSQAFANFGSFESQIQRIREYIKNPKIVFVIRNPIDLIISNYSYCVLNFGYFKKLNNYLDMDDRNMPYSLEKRKRFYLASLFYNNLQEKLFTIFGKKNVLIIKYELFKSKPIQFVDQLYEKFSIKFNNNFKKHLDQYLNCSINSEELEKVRFKNAERIFFELGFNFEQEISMLKPAYIKSEIEDLEYFFRSKVSNFYKL